MLFVNRRATQRQAIAIGGIKVIRSKHHLSNLAPELLQLPHRPLRHLHPALHARHEARVAHDVALVPPAHDGLAAGPQLRDLGRLRQLRRLGAPHPRQQRGQARRVRRVRHRRVGDGGERGRRGRVGGRGGEDDGAEGFEGQLGGWFGGRRGLEEGRL